MTSSTKRHRPSLTDLGWVMLAAPLTALLLVGCGNSEAKLPAQSEKARLDTPADFDFNFTSVTRSL